MGELRKPFRLLNSNMIFRLSGSHLMRYNALVIGLYYVVG